MSNPTAATAKHTEDDPLAGVVSPALMEGHGAYNQNIRLQAGGVAEALSLWQRAVQRATVDGAEPVVIADYGSSQGANSLLPMDVAIRTLRRRIANDRPISVFRIQQPLNDFNCLAEVLSSHPSRYTLSQPDVFTNMIGKSFYEQVLPANSVHLGWSSYAAVWLSRVPALIPNHIFSACATGEARAAFESQGTEDWKTFLHLRAREIRPGGRLVVVLPTAPVPENHTFLQLMNVANAALEGLAQD